MVDVDSIDIQCNQGAEPAVLHAPAAAGSDVKLTWTIWPESHVGPVITYMARCPEGGCQDWSPGEEYVFSLSPFPCLYVDCVAV